ncbi:hypothetical protein [Nitrospira sp. KM1]|uniref:hypothetical protein n=1 Tax=Nitrospira sp. KM1 TaxID=1936990 RepID=UPI0015641E28|nr:hypothetical protein [Nitrospira sp. KM1]
MPSMQAFLRWRPMILTWLIAWVLAVPLFHTHVPDTTDLWSTLQSGGVHTVFSPDLPGEFSPPRASGEQKHSRHLTQRAVHSPELEVSISDDKSEDRKIKRLHWLNIPHHFPDAPLQSFALDVSSDRNNRHLSESFSTSRAPPHSFI